MSQHFNSQELLELLLLEQHTRVLELEEHESEEEEDDELVQQGLRFVISLRKIFYCEFRIRIVACKKMIKRKMGGDKSLGLHEGFVVNVHDALNLDIDLVSSPRNSEDIRFLIPHPGSTITSTYRFVDLSPCLGIIRPEMKSGTAWRCRLRGIGWKSTGKNHRFPRGTVEVENLVNRTEGWIDCEIYPPDIYQRLLIDVYLTLPEGRVNLADYLLRMYPDHFFSYTNRSPNDPASPLGPLGQTSQTSQNGSNVLNGPHCPTGPTTSGSGSWSTHSQYSFPRPGYRRKRWKYTETPLDRSPES